MIEDFCLSTGMIFLAELGDKTQLVALTLATRYNTRVVLAGILVATLLVHIFSAALGNLAGGFLPTHWIQFLAGIAFVGFGLWTLRGDCVDEEECRHHQGISSPFLVVGTVFFLAELGDKTMLSTVTLATGCSFIPVWLGSTLGMVVSDGLAIWVGKILGSRLPERTVKTGAAIIFFAFGIWSGIQGGRHLSPVYWGLGAITVAILYLLFFHKRKPSPPQDAKVSVQA
jgi:putative Ca2+/H+ antiporter (TMEM165/GDT1 family)